MEQEYAADAWVASALNDSADYVRCLARLALTRGRGRVALAPAFWRRRPEILRRIDMLRRNPHGNSPRLGRRAAWTVTALTAAGCLAVAGVGPLRSAAQGQDPAPAAGAAPGRATADPLGDPLPAGALARLGTTRLRHDSDVLFVFFGADAKTLLTAGRDNTVRLWDLDSAKEIRRFTRPTPVAPKMPAKGAKLPARGATPAMMPGGMPAGGGFCVAVSADGKTVAAAGGNVVQLWEVESGKKLHQIRVAEGGLVGLLFSPDGKTLAGRVSDGGLLIWEADSDKLLHHIKPAPPPAGNRLLVIRGGEAGTPGMAFTPDSKALAAAMIDYEKETPVRSVKFWDLATGQESRRVKTPEGVSVSAVAVAPVGNLLAYGGRGVVHLCEADSGKELHQLKAPDGGVVGLVFSPDGKTLVARGVSQRTRLWEAATGKEIRQLGDTGPAEARFAVNAFARGPLNLSPEARTVAVSPDGARVAAASGNTVRLWDAATGKELPLPGGHRRAPTAVALSADGKTVVSWGTDAVVRRWEAATGKSLGEFPTPPGTMLAAFSADGGLVALANSDGSVLVCETATGKQRHRFARPPGPGRVNFVAGLVFSRDGRLLAVRGGGENVVRLYDVARGTELRMIGLRAENAPGVGRVVAFRGPVRGNGPGLAFSPDGKLLVAPAPTGNALLVLDVASGKELRKIPLTETASSFAFSPDGRVLATENSDRTVTLLEVASGKERARLGKSAFNRPQPDPRLAQLQLAGAIAVGNSAEPNGPVGVTFSPDGRALAVRGADTSVRVWDVTAGKEIGQLKGHGGGVETVAFAPDGKALASGADDTTILVWDAAEPLRGLSKPRPTELSAEQLETLWADLAGEHGGKALRGVLVLAESPGQAVPFLAGHLKPAARLDPEKLNGWLADLESAKFAVREQASASLLKAGDQALAALQKLLASSPALETRQRAEALVEKLITGALTVEQLRTIRAIEALERMGTPEARRLLRVLAEGGPGALPTREAQAALGRLGDPQP